MSLAPYNEKDSLEGTQLMRKGVLIMIIAIKREREGLNGRKFMVILLLYQ
jgi:hypothetical protein